MFSAMESYDEALKWLESQEASDMLASMKTLPPPDNDAALLSTKRQHIAPY